MRRCRDLSHDRQRECGDDEGSDRGESGCWLETGPLISFPDFQSGGLLVVQSSSL